MIPDARLQELIERKDGEEALRWCKEHGYGEGWSIIDGALVIYDIQEPPDWLRSVIEARDEDGNTTPKPVQGSRAKEREARREERISRERQARREAAGLQEA